MYQAIGVLKKRQTLQRLCKYTCRFSTSVEQIHKLKVPELKEFLKQNSIQFTSKTRKPELVQLALSFAEEDSEGKMLFQQLQALDPDTNEEDYFVDGEWDVDGLKDDVQIVTARQTTPTPKKKETFDNIFDEILGTPSSSTSSLDDLFATKASPRAPPQRTKRDEELNLDDILGPPKKDSELNLDEIFGKPKEKKESTESVDSLLDDIFGPQKTKNKGSLDLDDILGPAKESKAQKKQKEDEKIDSLLDDILGNMSKQPSVNPEREKKEQKVDNFLDDLLGVKGDKQPPAAKPKLSKKEEEAEINKLLDEIFDSKPTKSAPPLPSSQKSATDRLFDDLLSSKPKGAPTQHDPTRRELDDLLESILTAPKDYQPNKSATKEEMSDLESLIDDLGVRTQPKPGSWTTLRGNSGNFSSTWQNFEHRALMDVGVRGRLLVNNTGALLKEIKHSVGPGLRMFVTPAQYLQVEADDAEKIDTVVAQVRERTLTRRELYLAEVVFDFLMAQDDVKTACNETGCAVAYEKRSGMVNVSGDTAEEVARASKLISDQLKNIAFSRFPRFLHLVQPVLEEKFSHLHDVKIAFNQENPDDSPFFVAQGPRDELDDVFAAVKEALSSVNLANQENPALELVSKNAEFHEFCSANNVKFYYRKKKNRFWYVTPSPLLEQLVEDKIRDLSTKVHSADEFPGPVTWNLTTKLEHQFPEMEFAVNHEKSGLTFNTESCNPDDVFQWLESNMSLTEVKGTQIPIIEGSSRLVDAKRIEEESGGMMKVDGNTNIVLVEDEEFAEAIRSLIEEDQQSITSIPVEQYEKELLFGHRRRRLTSLSRFCGLDKFEIVPGALLLKGPKDARAEVEKFLADTRANYVTMEVPQKTPLHVTTILECDCDVYVISMEDKLVFSDKNSFLTQTNRQEDMKSRVLEHPVFREWMESVGTMPSFV